MSFGIGWLVTPLLAILCSAVEHNAIKVSQSRQLLDVDTNSTLHNATEELQINVLPEFINTTDALPEHVPGFTQNNSIPSFFAPMDLSAISGGEVQQEIDELTRLQEQQTMATERIREFQQSASQTTANMAADQGIEAGVDPDGTTSFLPGSPPSPSNLPSLKNSPDVQYSETQSNFSSSTLQALPTMPSQTQQTGPIPIPASPQSQALDTSLSPSPAPQIHAPPIPPEAPLPKENSAATEIPQPASERASPSPYLSPIRSPPYPPALLMPPPEPFQPFPPPATPTRSPPPPGSPLEPPLYSTPSPPPTPPPPPRTPLPAWWPELDATFKVEREQCNMTQAGDSAAYNGCCNLSRETQAGSCTCAHTPSCILSPNRDPCTVREASESCQSADNCRWEELSGRCRSATSPCDLLSSSPLECAWVPGCEVQHSCSDMCADCLLCVEMTVRFRRQELTAQVPQNNPGRLAARFVTACKDKDVLESGDKQQPAPDSLCASVGRSLFSRPELLHRQLALCSAASICSAECSTSLAEILKGIHLKQKPAEETLSAAAVLSWQDGAEMCLDLSAESAFQQVDPLFESNAGEVEFQHDAAPDNDHGFSSTPELVAQSSAQDAPVADLLFGNKGLATCTSAKDCPSGHECRSDRRQESCRPFGAQGEAACDLNTILDLPEMSRCPQACAEVGQDKRRAACDAAGAANRLLCESDDDCNIQAGLSCRPAGSCQVYSCSPHTGIAAVASGCPKRCLPDRAEVESAYLTDGGQAVTLELSQLATVPGAAVALDCAAVFDGATIRQLGLQPRCWVEDKRLRLWLGWLPALKATDSLALRDGQRDLRPLFSPGDRFLGFVANVTMNDTDILAPLASLSGPTKLNLNQVCSEGESRIADVILDGSSSFSAGPWAREAVEWSVRDHDAAAGQEITALLAAASAAKQLVVHIPVSALAALAAPQILTFSLSITDHFGRVSATEHSIDVTEGNYDRAMEVSIQGPDFQTFKASKGINLVAVTGLSSLCPPDPTVMFQWEDLDATEAGGDLLPFWGAADVINTELARLFIPPEALPPRGGDARRIRVTAFSNEGVTASTEIQVAIESSTEAIILHGPQGHVPVSRPIQFFAAPILDNPAIQSTPVVANFTCRHLPDFGPCVGKDGEAPLLSGMSFLLPEGILRDGHSYQVCMQASSTSFPSSQSCHIVNAVATKGTPLARIERSCQGAPAHTCRSNALHPAGLPVRLLAVPMDSENWQPGGLTYKWWSQQVDLVPGETCSLLNYSSITVYPRALPSHGGLVLMFVNVTSQSTGATAVLKVDLTVDASPFCTLDGLSQPCLDLKRQPGGLTAKARGWADPEGLPLTYEFGEVSQSGTRIPHTMQHPSAVFRFRLLLPDQPNRVYVCAIDAAGSRACSDPSEVYNEARHASRQAVASAIGMAVAVHRNHADLVLLAAQQGAAVGVELAASREAALLRLLAELARATPPASGLTSPVAVPPEIPRAALVSAVGILLGGGRAPPCSGLVVQTLTGLMRRAAAFAKTGKCLSRRDLDMQVQALAILAEMARRPECASVASVAGPSSAPQAALAAILQELLPALPSLVCLSLDEPPILATASVPHRFAISVGSWSPTDLPGVEISISTTNHSEQSPAAHSIMQNSRRRRLFESADAKHKGFQDSLQNSLRDSTAGPGPRFHANSCKECPNNVPLQLSFAYSETLADALRQASPSAEAWMPASGLLWLHGSYPGLTGTAKLPLLQPADDLEAMSYFCWRLSLSDGGLIQVPKHGPEPGGFGVSCDVSLSGGPVLLVKAPRPLIGLGPQQTPLAGIVEAWNALPTWQRVLIPTGIIVAIIAVSAALVGILCLCCRRRSLRSRHEIANLLQLSPGKGFSLASLTSPVQEGQEESHAAIEVEVHTSNHRSNITPDPMTDAQLNRESMPATSRQAGLMEKSMLSSRRSKQSQGIPEAAGNAGKMLNERTAAAIPLPMSLPTDPEVQGWQKQRRGSGRNSKSRLYLATGRAL